MKASVLNNPSGVIGFMLLSERIAEAIEGAGKTRAEISRACGVTNAAVTHWLNGDTVSLKADKALALEAATGYRAQWILSGRGPKKTADPYWPFSFPVALFEALTERQKGIVEGDLMRSIKDAAMYATVQTSPEKEPSTPVVVPKSNMVEGKEAKRDVLRVVSALPDKPAPKSSKHITILGGEAPAKKGSSERNSKNNRLQKSRNDGRSKASDGAGLRGRFKGDCLRGETRPEAPRHGDDRRVPPRSSVGPRSSGARDIPAKPTGRTPRGG